MKLGRLIFAVVFAATLVAARGFALAQEPAHKAETTTAHAEATGEEHEPDRNPMAFDPDLAIFSAVIFLLLLVILGKFAWPSIVSALDERERKIADNIAAAEARHEDAKRLFAEHETKLAAAAGEVRALLEEARRDAEVTKQRIEAEGRKAADDEVVRAKREIQRARDAAVTDLAERTANTAIDLARNVIRANLTPEQNNQLIRDAMAKFIAAPSQN